MQKARDSRAVGSRPNISSDPAEYVEDSVLAGFKNVSSSSIAVYPFDSSLRQNDRRFRRVSVDRSVSPRTPFCCFVYALLHIRGTIHNTKQEVFR